MTDNTIIGLCRVKFTKPGEKYHWVRETEWERQWEAEGLLPKRWAVAGEPLVVESYKEYQDSPEKDWWGNLRFDLRSGND